MSIFRIVPVGDATLVVEFEERIDPAVNARAVATAEALRTAAIAVLPPDAAPWAWVGLITQNALPGLDQSPATVSATAFV